MKKLKRHSIMIMILSPTEQTNSYTPQPMSEQPERQKKNLSMLTITLLILAVFSLTISGLLLYQGFTKPIPQTTPSTDLVSPPPTETTDSETSQITQNELDQGWYWWNSKDTKKQGTPDTWIFTGEGTKSAKWQKPDPLKPEDSTSFQCPTTEWVDCMPTIGGGGKIECTNDFLAWAKINCPNFKGAAL